MPSNCRPSFVFGDFVVLFSRWVALSRPAAGCLSHRTRMPQPAGVIGERRGHLRERRLSRFLVSRLLTEGRCIWSIRHCCRLRQRKCTSALFGIRDRCMPVARLGCPRSCSSHSTPTQRWNRAATTATIHRPLAQLPISAREGGGEGCRVGNQRQQWSSATACSKRCSIRLSLSRSMASTHAT